MSVQRYQRRKPKREVLEDMFVARYEPGQPLDDLATVARKADPGAGLVEVTFPSGAKILVVRWLDIPDDHPGEVKYETVEAGDYLAYSRYSDFLFDTDDSDLRAFYDLVPDEE